MVGKVRAVARYERRYSIFPERYTKAVYPLVEAIEDIMERRHNDLEDALEKAMDKDERQRLRQQQRRFAMAGVTRCMNSDGIESMMEGKGRTRPPEPMVLHTLAQCLDCNVAETNKLLHAVNHQPLPLRAPESNAHHRLLNYVPLPGFIIDHLWNIPEVNPLFWRLFAIPPEHWDGLRQERRNMLYLVFAKHLEFRDRITPDPKKYPGEWERLVRVMVRAFKTQRALTPEHMQEGYQPIVEMCMGLPDFERIWNAVHIDTDITPYPMVLPQREGETTEPKTRNVTADATIFLLNTAHHKVNDPNAVPIVSVRAAMGDAPYPMTFLYLPVNRAAERWFHDIGLPTKHYGWDMEPDGATAETP